LSNKFNLSLVMMHCTIAKLLMYKLPPQFSCRNLVHNLPTYTQINAAFIYC